MECENCFYPFWDDKCENPQKCCLERQLKDALIKNDEKKVCSILDEFEKKNLVPDSGCLCLATTESMARQLVKHSVHIDLNGTWTMSWDIDSSLITPIHFAIVKRHEYLVKVLIEAGADLNYRDNRGLSAIDKCIKKYKYYRNNNSKNFYENPYENIMKIVLGEFML